MKFVLTSTDFDTREGIQIEYPCVEDYQFDETEEFESEYEYGDPVRPAYVTINSLEELLAFMKAVDKPLILSGVDHYYGSFKPSADYEIEIYDGYRE